MDSSMMEEEEEEDSQRSFAPGVSYAQKKKVSSAPRKGKGKSGRCVNNISPPENSLPSPCGIFSIGQARRVSKVLGGRFVEAGMNNES